MLGTLDTGGDTYIILAVDFEDVLQAVRVVLPLQSLGVLALTKSSLSQMLISAAQ